MNVTPIETYKTYISIKNHFTRLDYDYLKYNGKVKAGEKSFYGRRDRFWFEKLSRQKKDKEILDFFIANFSSTENPQSLWIGEIIRNGDNVYIEWQKKIQSLSYIFKSEVESILTPENFDKMFFAARSKHPPVLKEYIKKNISLETLIILNKILGFKKDFDTKLKDPVWESISMKITKYSPFLNIDIFKFKKILKDIIL
jgi:hypothetical protein